MIRPTFQKAYSDCKRKRILNRSKSGGEQNHEQNTEFTLPSLIL